MGSPYKSDYSEFRPKGYPVIHRKKDLSKTRIALPREYRSMANEIRELDRELDRFVLKAEDYKAIVDQTYASNIYWSVRIEGNTLPFGEVERLTSVFTEGKPCKAETRQHQEIINQLYSFFMDNDFKFPWTMQSVTDIHRLLMIGVMDRENAGHIRDREVGVYGGDGTEYFRACPAKYVQSELDSMIEWLKWSPFDEIITAIIFFHEFESIHPFLDGNGRTGRELFTRILQRYGLRNCRLCRFEEEILSDTSTYYDLLSYTDDTEDYVPLIMYVTESLLFAYRDAVDWFESKNLMCNLSSVHRFLIEESRKVERFTIKDAHMWVPEISEQTLRSRLENLVGLGLVEKNGATRGLTYRYKDPLRQVKSSVRGEYFVDEGGQMMP